MLTEAGLLKPDERLSFTEPVVASAIEAAQIPGERAAAHLAAARMMSEDQASAEAASRHLLQASRTGSAWVVDCLCQAATLALGRGAPREAVRYLRRASPSRLWDVNVRTWPLSSATPRRSPVSPRPPSG